MLSEVILILGGHASSLFEQPGESSTADATSSLLASLTSTIHSKAHLPLHPGERAQLDHLATLAFRCKSIKQFATHHLDAAHRRALRQSSSKPRLHRSGPKIRARDVTKVDLGAATADSEDITAHLAPLCRGILQYLEQYDELVIDLEARLLARDAAFVGEGSYVSLATLRAEMQIWESRLAALSKLIELLLRGPRDAPSSTASQIRLQIDGEESEELEHPEPGLAGWTAGLLIDLLTHLSETGISRVATMMAALRDTVEDSFKVLLCDWICHGVASGSPVSLGPNLTCAGPDAIVEQTDDENTWQLTRWALPSSIAPITADAILYGGRAIYRVKSQQSSHHQLPAALMATHLQSLRKPEVRPSKPLLFAKSVMEIKQDVGEWLWRNVLTDQAVLSALQDLGNYFLLRSGNFSLSLMEELESARRQKGLSARTAAAAELTEADLDLALHRASQGTELEDDPSLELLHWRKSPASRKPAPSGGDTSFSVKGNAELPPRFDEELLGVPAQLRYATDFPMELFLSGAELDAYSKIFSYLFALKRTNHRVLSCWRSLSNNQRLRRKFTGTGEGGSSREETTTRTNLLRLTWSLARDMLWFLDTLHGHFQVRKPCPIRCCTAANRCKTPRRTSLTCSSPASLLKYMTSMNNAQNAARSDEATQLTQDKARPVASGPLHRWTRCPTTPRPLQLLCTQRPLVSWLAPHTTPKVTLTVARRRRLPDPVEPVEVSARPEHLSAPIDGWISQIFERRTSLSSRSCRKAC